MIAETELTGRERQKFIASDLFRLWFVPSCMNGRLLDAYIKQERTLVLGAVNAWPKSK